MQQLSQSNPTIIPLLSEDCAYIEHDNQLNWIVYYRMFIDWGNRTVVCEGKSLGFNSYDAALGWIFDTFPFVVIISKQEFLTERESVSRFQ